MIVVFGPYATILVCASAFPLMYAFKNTTPESSEHIPLHAQAMCCLLPRHGGEKKRILFPFVDVFCSIRVRSNCIN